jgi:hypothetical protein
LEIDRAMADRRPRDWTSWRLLAMGATIAVAAGVAGSYLYREPAAVAILTGERAIAPITVSPRNETVASHELRFEWKAADAVRIVVIDLSADDKRVIDRVVVESPYAPSDEEREALRSSHQYQWYVETVASDGRGMTSGAGRFAIR